MHDNRGPQGEPIKPVNPYESPQSSVRRGPLLVRLARAARRGFATYWVEIQKSNLTTVEHFGAWFTLAFGALIVVAIGSAFLWFLVTQLVSEL
ncbi:MAG: hypothetical protein QGF59_23750 [Pirellulaceae bacterium]|jgi:uncharacterized membrane protein|nr:hypothetical protein [Pirellulaceae bacterium]MDP6721703.1 hypothetical protein [Pirellulaceae bacterium]